MDARALAAVVVLAWITVLAPGCGSVRVPALGFHARGRPEALLSALADAAERDHYPVRERDDAGGRFRVRAHASHASSFVVEVDRNGVVRVTPEGPIAEPDGDGWVVSRGVRTEWARFVAELEVNAAVATRGDAIDTRGWAASTDVAALRHPVQQNGEDPGLLSLAFVLFDVGWLTSIIAASFEAATPSCLQSFAAVYMPVGCDSWSLGFIPIVGGVISGELDFAPGTYREHVAIGGIVGGTGAGLQLAGLVTLAVALANQTHGWSLLRMPAGGPIASLSSTAGGVGVELRW